MFKLIRSSRRGQRIRSRDLVYLSYLTLTKHLAGSQPVAIARGHPRRPILHSLSSWSGLSIRRGAPHRAIGSKPERGLANSKRVGLPGSTQAVASFPGLVLATRTGVVFVFDLSPGSKWATGSVHPGGRAERGGLRPPPRTCALCLRAPGSRQPAAGPGCRGGPFRVAPRLVRAFAIVLPSSEPSPTTALPSFSSHLSFRSVGSYLYHTLSDRSSSATRAR